MTLPARLAESLGLDRVLLGAVAISLAVLALELACLAGLSAPNGGRLTQSPTLALRLASWAPWIFGACLAVHGLADAILRRLGKAVLPSRLIALSVTPLGLPLVPMGLVPWSRAEPLGEALFFLVTGTIFGYALLTLPLLFAAFWTRRQVAPSFQAGVFP